MKKYLVIAVFVALCLVSVSAQARLDLGIDIPLRISAVMEGSELTGSFNVPYTLPFPSAGLYYTTVAGPLNLGIGARMYSLILVSALWPNVIAELDLGPAILEAQLGGGAFLFFGLVSSTQTGAVFIPDLSAWFKLGKTLRAGGGAMGLFIDELAEEAMPVVFYLGVKAAIGFD
ncbi:MAG: hypothetical protein ABIJ86_16755 [Spirochaetota bacterium]